jgi:hypothetical protein
MARVTDSKIPNEKPAQKAQMKMTLLVGKRHFQPMNSYGIAALSGRLPNQYKLAVDVGKWVWLDVLPTQRPMLAKVFWSLGFLWNQRRSVWEHRCGKFGPLGSHPTDPRANYRSHFPADLLPA